MKSEKPLDVEARPFGAAAARPVEVRAADPASPSARRLLGELDAYQLALYPAGSLHLMPVEDLRGPGVTFLTATAGEEVVGCAALVRHEEYAEVKRMFVVPQARGLGVGRRLLAELEALARASGLRVVRLETGVAQPEALRLYERAGYLRRGPFGDYPEDPLSVFLEKSLNSACRRDPRRPR
jgi:putative acetyltransferase